MFSYCTENHPKNLSVPDHFESEGLFLPQGREKVEEEKESLILLFHLDIRKSSLRKKFT
jgi:hypothetical protein